MPQKISEKVIIPQYALYNHGRWAVLVKPGLEFIGWCGLKYRPALNEIDPGYRFKKISRERDMLLRLPMPQSDVALRN